MEFIDHAPTGKGPAERFTGDVWVETIVQNEAPSRLRAALVRFAPGAHTFWHRHLVGQTIHVTRGVALVGTRDGRVLEVHPGETVSCPPGEDHWHGATPERFMEHLVMWEGDGTGAEESDWFEEVAPERYAAPRTRSGSSNSSSSSR